MTSRKSKLWCAICLLMLASLACNAVLPQPGPTPPPAEVTQLPVQPAEPLPPAQPGETQPPVLPATLPPGPATATAPIPMKFPTNVYPPIFAKYNVSAIHLPGKASADYSLPVDIAAVKGLADLGLSSQQLALLGKNGFAAAAPVPGKYREFYQVYESLRYEDDQPVFATLDSIFHVYHLIFDKMLRDLERDSFFPDLQDLTRLMVAQSQRQYQALQGTPLEEPARRNLAFFVVAAQLLGLQDPIPPAVTDLVSAELALINAHAGVNVSPLWDRPDLSQDKKLNEDYSQYIPRGHYTRSEALKAYFKTMMWYGRLTFRLRDRFETRRALLLTKALRTAQASDGRSALQLWQNIYEPTVFIVGKSDDISYFEYGALSDQVFGPDSGPEAFADEAKLAQFLANAQALPPPQVNSMWVWIWESKDEATKGFRFMGQRFTLDEYVFGQLIWREVGSTSRPRGLPKGLDFIAALGSDEALNILNAMGENQYEKYTTQMDKVRKEVAGLQPDSWTQNLYWSWLYAFQPVIQPKDAQFPVFMRTQAWTRKQLNTVLGSWTELKHDTILYAKQVMAEMGGGAPENPPHGWVEPNPEAYARLRALADMTYNGLQDRGLLSERTRGNLDNLIDTLTFMQSVAERELIGERLTDDEYWRIQYYGGTLEAFTLTSSDCESPDPVDCRDLTDQKSPLIADVATGLDPQGNLAALEEATGQPVEIYVVLPGQPLQVAVGAIYSYYEFTVDPGGRMTDETWQGMVAAGQTPPLPDWVSLFLAP